MLNSTIIASSDKQKDLHNYIDPNLDLDGHTTYQTVSRASHTLGLSVKYSFQYLDNNIVT